MNTCSQCGKQDAMITLTTETEQRSLCRDCYNEVLSIELGVQLIDLPDSIIVKDSEGIRHYFYVRPELFHQGIRLEAGENDFYGYRFEVFGELDCDQEELFQKLYDKVKDGVSRKYINQKVLPGGHTYQTMPDDELVGRIEYNEEDPDVPLVIIDGKPYNWEEIGNMMRSYEGFQFHLHILNEDE